MASVLDCGCDWQWQRGKWKLLVVLSALQASLHQAVAGSCGNDEKTGKRNQDDNCWYELWYFWFILVLAFLTIVVLVIFYCKQQVKRSSGRRGRRRTPVLTMPMAPPQYEAPGHQPPPYHIAMSTTLPADQCPPHATHSPRGLGQQGSANHSATQGEVSLPGYVVQASDLSAYDNLSWASTLSVGTFSNPPPYSPPPASNAVNRQRQDHADVAL